ncbi:carboxypeptidase-like regulatory domain-containing protein [Marinoscillum sp.]|uniref:carboxypeptidase-like regulatory domain-containing protein n=1 Tax=Marinoscillum sp. TaxID=2024838 RepID=UPI003BA880B7
MFVLTLSGRTQDSGGQLSFSNESLEQVINRLGKAYNLQFRYKQEWIQDIRVSGSVSKNQLNETLTSLLKPYGISFIVRDTDLIILLKDGSTTFSYQEETPSANSNIIAIGDVKVGLTEAVLSGTISSGETGESLPGVAVFTDEYSTVSDQSGNYSIKLPVGVQTITYKYLGYSELSFVIMLNSNGEFNLNMYEDITQLDEIIISPEDRDENVTSVIAGSEQMTIEEIKKLPAMFGEVDVVRSLLSMPGVNTVGEGAAGFNVRGSSASQNLILLEKGTLYNSSHLFGFFSAISADAIDKVQLYRGSIPAEYGGRIASALDIDLKSASKHEIKGNGGVGLVASRFNLELPIKKKVSSLNTSIRAAYPNTIIRRVDNPDFKQSSAFFGDLSMKYDHTLSENHRLIASGYTSYDDFTLASEAEYGYRNTIGTIQWIGSTKNNLQNDLIINYSGYHYDLLDRSNENQLYQLSAGINDFKVQSEFDYLGFSGHQLSFGGSLIHHSLSPGDYQPVDNSIIEPVTLADESGNEIGVFVSDQYQFSPSLSVYAGMRYSLFQGGLDTYAAFYHGLEPRFSVNYRLNPYRSIKLGYNRMRQYIHQISNTTAITPIDSWKLSNELIKPTIADQVSLGYFQNSSKNDYEFSSEVYYKLTQNLIEYKNGADLFRNPDLEGEVVQGTGNAYGLEISLKKNTGDLTGWINYTFSRSFNRVTSSDPQEAINEGNNYPTNFDQPHNLNVFNNIVLSRRFSLSANYIYNTGRPVTVPETSYRLYDLSVAHYSQRNTYRIPDYHRLDLTLYMGTNLKKDKEVEANWSVTVYNIYARKNVYSVFYRRNNADRGTDAFKFIVIGRPLVAISYNFKF